MNRREKILMSALGVVLVLFAARGIRNWYVDTKADLASEKAGLDKELNKLKLNRDEVRMAEDRWRRIGSQTLSTDAKEVRRLLRDRLVDITRESGMPGVTPNPGEAIPYGGRNGLRVVTCTIDAESTLPNIMKFLFTLHRQPFLVRCRTLSLTPVVDKVRSDGREGGAPPASKSTDRFTMKVGLEVLLLPTGRDVPAVTTAPAASEPVHLAKMPLRDSVGDYSSITMDLFTRYVRIEPPAKAVASYPTNGAAIPLVDPDNFMIRWQAGARAKQHVLYFGETAPGESRGELKMTSWKVADVALEIDKTYYWRVDEIGDGGTTQGDVWSFTLTEKPETVVQQPEPRPEPPEPPVYEDLTIRGVLSSAVTQQVVLTTDPKNPKAPDTRVQVGERLFKGVLIFVHPKGVVTAEAVRGKNGTELVENGTRWFHPIDGVIRNGQILSEKDHPQVFYELAKLEERLLSIREELEQAAPGGAERGVTTQPGAG